MSAKVYVASPLGSNAIQSPAFVEREIKDCTTGRLDTILTIGLPTQTQIAYPQYVANLSAFLHSTATQKRVTCGGTYLSALAPELLLPLKFPALCIAPTAPFENEEQKTTFLGSINGGYSTITLGNRELYVIPDATIASLPTLPPANAYSRCPKGAVNLAAFKSFATTVKLVTAGF